MLNKILILLLISSSTVFAKTTLCNLLTSLPGTGSSLLLLDSNDGRYRSSILFSDYGKDLRLPNVSLDSFYAVDTFYGKMQSSSRDGLSSYYIFNYETERSGQVQMIVLLRRPSTFPSGDKLFTGDLINTIDKTASTLECIDLDIKL